MRKLLSMMALFVVSLLLVSMVSAGTSTLGDLEKDHFSFEVNGEDVAEDDAALLTLQEGEKLSIEVEIDYPNTEVVNAAGDLVDPVDARYVEVTAAFVADGYKYYDKVDLEVTSYVFDVDAGERKFVELELEVPEDFNNNDEDFFTLEIEVEAGLEELKFELPLKVVSARHDVQVEDVFFSPGSTVKAGRILYTTVLLENDGKYEAEDVVVNVAIPALNLEASEFVGDIEEDSGIEEVPEMFLQVPYTAVAGDYEVVVTVEYDKYETVSEVYTLTIVESDVFHADLVPASDKLILAVGPETQTVGLSQTATYAVALNNAGKASKAYTFEAVTGDWATASVSESLVVLAPGQNKVVYVDVAVAADAVAGEHTASLVVKSGNDVLETVALTANVVAPAAEDVVDSFSLRNGLEIALIVLVVLLVIIGLIVGFSRLRKDDEEEQTYY